MTCCCGHGPWRYHDYPYPSMAYAPTVYPPPPPGYARREGYGRRGRRRRAQAEELAGYLQELEEEIADIRRELDELTATETTED